MIPLRDEIESYSKPFVTYFILALNILVYLFEFLIGEYKEQFIYQFGAIPYELFNPSGIKTYFTVLSSMFTHANFMHLAGNMLFLWVFADNVEDFMGHIKFLFFYIICGVAAVFAHSLTAPTSKIPMVGASGAVSGVMGAYLVYFPSARILSLIPLGFFLRITYLPSLFFIGIWFFYQFLFGFASLGFKGGGVAYFAHIGGFIMGVLLALIFRRRRKEYDYEIF
jgi:membrane associated rhomboid family serine protease|uniref:Rhomboid family intramembrane serine protease n=1 Tax=candidate division WOR-3 bacterium TaxID=2052148 RepID=A0A7V3RG87_UNCW3